MKQPDLTRNGSDVATASPEPTPAQGLAVTLLTHERDFAALRTEWNPLAAAHPIASAFLRYEWADAAWQWRRQDATLALLTVRGGNGELVGVAPLVRTQDREIGLSFRRLELLSVPDNQFADILFAPDHLPAVAGAIAGWLRDNPQYWDQLTLRLLHNESPTAQTLSDALEQMGLLVVRQTNTVNYSIDLTGTWENYYRSRSRRLKKGNNLVANRLHRAGELQLTCLKGREIDEQTANIVRHLSAASWKQATGTTLDQPGPKAFFDRLFQYACQQEWLSVWLLTLDTLPVAAELQLEHKGLVHGLRSDFRTDLEALSPGTYLNWKIIEGLFDQGLKVYFLGPGENPYKRRWTDTGTPLTRLDAWSPALRGRLLRALRQWLRPTLRSARDHLQDLYHRARRL
ncbi:GNAT family N-acetyltransferase [Nitrococcus mobilis]|uniref:Cellulose biosynthesis-like protein n=1 Tax=Nitrococcus mobilis Nb-231 TaxID=314278 RepID=A4BT65_9GAMM|nr:GNAT family N-acetyltransferase [Nitrococcus mobilis]EAR21133.1 cellulose biosynthesis-like protein [Nitrococcus mobilis Nb-231]